MRMRVLIWDSVTLKKIVSLPLADLNQKISWHILKNWQDALAEIPYSMAEYISIESGETIYVDYIVAVDPSIVPESISRERLVSPELLYGTLVNWMKNTGLKEERLVFWYTPVGLLRQRENYQVRAEFVGGCFSEHMVDFLTTPAGQLGYSIDARFTVWNYPLELPNEQEEQWDFRVIVPPFRFLHDQGMDNFWRFENYKEDFKHVSERLLEYVALATKNYKCPVTFVVGFVEPLMNPLGVVIKDASERNFKYFVRRLNDALEDWCARQENCFFIDANEVASITGKTTIAEDGLWGYAHRSILSEHDDVLDADFERPIFSAKEVFEPQYYRFYQSLNSWIINAYKILTENNKVKLVIVDLDNTLWRGLASDRRIGSFEGRISGLIEALLILKRRGIMLAVVSKNDEVFIRREWESITKQWAEEPLQGRLTLDDFVMAKINFEPKHLNVAEIIKSVGVLPDSVVFIDDNAMEREDVHRNIPQVQILGFDMNSVRRELIFSSRTQSSAITDEDARRSETVRSRVEIIQNHELLQQRHFFMTIGEVTNETPAEVITRIIQLINKTNQWTMDGKRITPEQFKATLNSGGAIFASLRDDFTDYGITIVMLTDFRNITSFVQSCRIIGFGMAEAFSEWVVRKFGSLQICYVDTGRNAAFREFMRGHSVDDGDRVYLSPNTAIIKTNVSIEYPFGT